MKLSKLIKEEVNKYVSHVINEDNDFNYVLDDNIREEFIDALNDSNGSITISSGDSDFEVNGTSHLFYVEYSYENNGYIDTFNSNDYDVPDDYEVHDDINFECRVYYSSNEDGDYDSELEVDEELKNIILDSVNVEDEELPYGRE